MKLSLRQCLRFHKNSATSRHRRNWANLPIELLGLILGKLVLLPDYIRFGAVCKGWLSAARVSYQDRCRTCYQHPPMILLPLTPLFENRRPSSSILLRSDLLKNRRCLYSMWEEKIYCRPLIIPDIHTDTETILGSSYGWFLVSCENRYIKLFNPFSINSIRLPIINFASKSECTVTLSCDPSLNPDDWVAIAIYDMESRLAIVRAGHDSWHRIRYPKNGVIAAGFYKGNLYVMNRSCELWRIAIQDGADFGLVKMVKQLRKVEVQTWRCKFYFVELDGDLLLVSRNYVIREQGLFSQLERTLGFCVHKLCRKEEQLSALDSDDEFAEWVEVKDLGEFCLFLGRNKPICISTATFHDCRPNCIYYTDDTINNYLYYMHSSGDMGVFDLATGGISSFDSISAFQHEIPSAIWISPNLC